LIYKGKIRIRGGIGENGREIGEENVMGDKEFTTGWTTEI
jgi:hypothetical protein